MGCHAEWEIVNKKDGIVLIRDLNRPGCLSVTNDAEYVYAYINQGLRYRVVYEDTQGEWTELIGKPKGNTLDSPWQWNITFKPWHGEVWDSLTKTY